MYKFKEDKMNVPAFVYQEKGAIEDGAIEQLKNMASLPFVYHHVSAMPDCHQGYGMPIGGVLVTEGVVIPNAVGVDIGCGMGFVQTDLRVDQLSEKRLKEIMSLIRKKIPVGFNKHKKPQDVPEIFERFIINEKIFQYNPDNVPICKENFDKSLLQLGTLGGGNHFIEIQKSDDGYICFMVHSGSRNLGYTVAKHYNEIAKNLNKKLYSSIPEEYDLAFLPLGTLEGKAYLREMDFCLNYAKANRDLMIERIKESFNEILCEHCKGNGGVKGQRCGKCDGKGIFNITNQVIPEFGKTINIHHNYAAMEHHFGKNVMVHRKGATRAYDGEFGIIPGSQGTSSYIVQGKGNLESFKSCSHGAGRKMSRTKARANLNLKSEQEFLDNQGIVHSIRNKASLDEATSAYKDIDQVMSQQTDLVDIVLKLTPLGVIKG